MFLRMMITGGKILFAIDLIMRVVSVWIILRFGPTGLLMAAMISDSGAIFLAEVAMALVAMIIICFLVLCAHPNLLASKLPGDKVSNWFYARFPAFSIIALWLFFSTRT